MTSENWSHLRDECDAANKETLRFGNSSSLANHYDKHSIFPQIDGANKIYNAVEPLLGKYEDIIESKINEVMLTIT